MASFMFPPVGFGPGSQPGEEDGEDLNYLAMPSGMQTFSVRLPEVDDPAAVAGAVKFLRELSRHAAGWSVETGTMAADYDMLDARNQATLRDVLGEGEVAVRIASPDPGMARIEVQESVFTGVWRVMRGGHEHIEIGAIPDAVLMAPRIRMAPPPLPGPGVVNAPAIITEILDHVGDGVAGDTHVINLTLLPHTPEDLEYLDLALGDGGVTLLSRGYGNCRIDRCAHPHVWRVRYYNSQDVLILDTIEISDIPDVACAAPEDIADSAERLAEVAEALL